MIQLKISHSIGRWQIMSTKVDLNWNFPGHSKPCVWRKSVLPTWRSRWLWWRWSWWRLKYLTYMLNKEEETLLIMYSFIENFTCFSLACSVGVLSGWVYVVNNTYCSTPPLSFVLTVAHPLGTNIFLSSVLHCLKKVNDSHLSNYDFSCCAICKPQLDI